MSERPKLGFDLSIPMPPKEKSLRELELEFADTLVGFAEENAANATSSESASVGLHLMEAWTACDHAEQLRAFAREQLSEPNEIYRRYGLPEVEIASIRTYLS